VKYVKNSLHSYTVHGKLTLNKQTTNESNAINNGGSYGISSGKYEDGLKVNEQRAKVKFK